MQKRPRIQHHDNDGKNWNDLFPAGNFIDDFQRGYILQDLQRFALNRKLILFRGA